MTVVMKIPNKKIEKEKKKKMVFSSDSESLQAELQKMLCLCVTRLT